MRPTKATGVRRRRQQMRRRRRRAAAHRRGRSRRKPKRLRSWLTERMSMPLLAAASHDRRQLVHVHDMRRGQQDAAQAERRRALEEMAQPVLAVAEVEQHQVEAERLELALHVLGERRIDALLDVAGDQRHRAAAADAQAARHLVGPVAELLDRLQHARARLGRDRHAAGQHARHRGRRDAGMGRRRRPRSPSARRPLPVLRRVRLAQVAQHGLRRVVAARCRRCSCRARCRCR